MKRKVMKRKEKEDAEQSKLGEIRTDTIYPLPKFKEVSGLSTAALRTARRNGLMVHYCGGRGFVTGKCFGEYLDSLGK